MPIEVHPPITLSEKGRRRINEDYVFAAQKRTTTAKGPLVYLVCDGVGGEARGEVASRLAGETIGDELQRKRGVKGVLHAVEQAQKALSEHTAANKDAKGMATTLGLLLIDVDGVTIAHMGDSRVYQLRGADILHKTTDHSFVQELLDNKLITREQAAQHPRRNVITRAVMQGPDLVEPEMSHLTDLEAGDVFFLCSDGVTETFPDAELVELLNDKELTDAERMTEIGRRCRLNSRDNYTACLVRLAFLSPGWKRDNELGILGQPLKNTFKALLRKMRLLED